MGVDSVTRQLFVIKSSTNIEAKLICRDNTTKVDIPKYCEIYLPEFCSIHSDQFIILENEQKGLKEIYVSEYFNVTDLSDAVDTYNL